jgi:hypothetical protein
MDVHEGDDLDAALATFDELSPPAQPLENAASQVYERLWTYFAARDWAAIVAMLADDSLMDDRRRVVNAGIRHGRDALMVNGRALAEVGVETVRSTVVATRGTRLGLCRIRAVTSGPGEYDSEALHIVDIDADDRISAVVMFDVDDLEAAFEELDARYLAGEAAPYRDSWSVIAEAYAALNRHEIPTTAPNWVDIDHRHGMAIARGDLIAFIRATIEDTPDIGCYVEAVHRLSNNGAIVTSATRGTSQGFDAEWRHVGVVTVDGNTISRTEIFDETDLDAALARFDELTRSAPQLENAASKAGERFLAYFAARDWEAMAEILADDYWSDDRRRVVNAGIQQGRDAEIVNMQAINDLWNTNVSSNVIGTRGGRLTLMHARYSGRDQAPEAFLTEILGVIEINGDGRISSLVVFDPDDIDAAFEELDARYLAGEAAAHATSWSVVADTYAAFNRRELRATAPGWVNIDHRRGAAFASGDMIAYVQAAWDDSPDTKIYVAAVHRLNNLGAVVTHVAQGISREGFDAEWRDIQVLTMDGDLLTHSELFNEADLDAALARFDELTRPAPQPQNAANRVLERYFAHFAAREWDAMAETLADDFMTHDRRRVVNAGVRHGRAAEIANMQAFAEIGTLNITMTVVATRGERLVLVRDYLAIRDWSESEPSHDGISVIEINSDNRISAHVLFEPDDFDAAFEELDAMYTAGEAATHANTWSVVAASYAAMNRHEFPPATPNWVNIDHRRATPFAPNDLTAIINTSSVVTPDLRSHVETVHRLSDLGAVVSQVSYGTSQEGFDAEWRFVNLLTVEGDLINRSELFDEADLDAALARFDELDRPAPLENAASRAYDQFNVYLMARDWDAMAELIADDICNDDRRRVVSSGVRRGRDAETANLRAVVDVGVKNFEFVVIATRGERVALMRACVSGGQLPEAFGLELLTIIEIDSDNRISSGIQFDVDDIDAAFEELDARYVVGEAVTYAHTWSVIARGLAAFNGREMPGFTPGLVNIDHRRGRGFAPGDLPAYIGATWDLAPNVSAYAETVHRLSRLGAVWTHAVRGTSQDGFDAEWREICLATVEGDLISRIEMFEEDDVDAALARFDELSVSAPQLENAATRTWRQIVDAINRRDADGFHALSSADGELEDRRKGLRASHRGSERRRAAEAMCRTPESWHLEVEPIAIRGHRLGLTRDRWRDTDEADRPITVESLTLTEVTRDELAHHTLVFDPDDIDAAFEELDARYLAGEAAPHAHAWSVIAEAYASIRRHELPPAMSGCVNVDHRGAAAFAPGELVAWIRAGLEIDQTFGPHMEVVHRLTNRGAVVTYAAEGTSPEGFDAEWREISLSIVDGDMISRRELYDAADVDAALARFDELSRPAPRLENAASQVTERLWAHFMAREWDAVARQMAQNVAADDRRRVVNSGALDGRDSVIAALSALAEVGVKHVTSEVIAIRGERLVLSRTRSAGSERPEAFHVDALDIFEIDAHERIASHVAFDLDDVDAAFAELECRYVAGEAAAHSHTFSLIARAFAAINRRELPKLTPDWVNIDHRRGIAFEPGDMTEFIRAIWDDTPDVNVYIEAVHRLSDLGAVVTQAATGTSQQGFAAEWRAINISTVDGDLINRCELYDDADLDAALTRFDELSRSAPRLRNAACRAGDRYLERFAAHDWNAMAEMLADDFSSDDRRRVVGAGVRHGQDAEIASMRAVSNVGFANARQTCFAERGGRLTLSRIRFSGRDHGPEAVVIDALGVLELEADNRIAATVVFDADDIGAAFAELDARYLAGEAAPHSHTWSVIAANYAAFNRHEYPSTTPDWVTIDHRRAIPFEPGALTAYAHALWDVAPDATVYIETVHRLSDLGAVVTQATKGTSRHGFKAEWREIAILMLTGDMTSRTELFDEADLDTAVARFDELNRQAP